MPVAGFRGVNGLNPQPQTLTTLVHLMPIPLHLLTSTLAILAKSLGPEEMPNGITLYTFPSQGIQQNCRNTGWRGIRV